MSTSEQRPIGPTREQVRASSLFTTTIGFWFNGSAHLRSPFPPAWHDALQELVLDRFHAWLNTLDHQARHLVNDDAVSGKLEELLFKAGLEMAQTEEERNTILYPFLPRPGDPIMKAGCTEADSTVTARKLCHEGKDAFMEVTALRQATGETWSTRFELP